MERDDKAQRRASQRQSRSVREPRPIGDILGDRLNQIPGIPTMYGGIEFRSRLEATWAAFFDLCGWKWSYEPEEQNGWIPDFTLGYKPIFVEVKPYRYESDWSDAISKIKNSGVHRRVVLLGADPTFLNSVDDFGDAPRIGWMLWLDEQECFTSDLHFGFTEGCSDDSLGLCSLDGGWWNVIWDFSASNSSNKLSRVWPIAERRRWPVSDGESCRDTNVAHELLRAYWLIARNAARWKP